MAFTVIGMFDSKSSADSATNRLVAEGFEQQYIDNSPYRADDTETLTDNNYYDYEEDEKTTGFFDWLFGDDEYERNRYSEVATRSYVITVQSKTKAEAERAVAIMDNFGAVDVNEHARGTACRYRANAAVDTDVKTAVGKEKIEVVEEELNVGKRTVNTGGVRVRSRIVEKPVEEKLRLKEERVYVRRNPVNRPAKLTDIDTFKTGTIEMKEEAEVAVAEKSARVVEEITVGKEVNTDVETIRDTVRKTEVDVEEVTGVDLNVERNRANKTKDIVVDVDRTTRK